MKAPPNIKSNPVFIPTPGAPSAASTADRYVKDPETGFCWPIWDGGQTLGQIRIEEERAKLQQERRQQDRLKRAERRERLGKLCATCKGKSVEWKAGHCPTCNNTGKRNP